MNLELFSTPGISENARKKGEHSEGHKTSIQLTLFFDLQKFNISFMP